MSIFFVDYGKEDSVDCRDIRLDIILEDIPLIAISCKLFNIRPVGGQQNWPTRVLHFIYVNIVESDEFTVLQGLNPPFEVELSSKHIVSLGHFLVEKNTLFS